MVAERSPPINSGPNHGSATRSISVLMSGRVARAEAAPALIRNPTPFVTIIPAFSEHQELDAAASDD